SDRPSGHADPARVPGRERALAAKGTSTGAGACLRTRAQRGAMYREVLVPVDNSDPSHWSVDRAIEICRKSGGRITGNHVYAARLHDVRFRQLETGLPAQFQTPEEIKRQRKVHDKLIEKGLQL